MCILYVIFEIPGYVNNSIIEITKTIIECKNTNVVKKGKEKYTCTDFLKDETKLFLINRHGNQNVQRKKNIEKKQSKNTKYWFIFIDFLNK